MGNKKLESKPNEPKKDGYRVVTYTRHSFPPELKNLIIANFLNSLRYGNDLFKLIDNDAYYKAYGQYVEGLLNKINMRVNVALLDDDSALGWCLYDFQEPSDVLHYVWIKKEARRQGICKALLPESFDTFTHITNKGMNIWVNKYPESRFNPFA